MGFSFGHTNAAARRFTTSSRPSESGSGILPASSGTPSTSK
jgi:hypothetical protein